MSSPDTQVLFKPFKLKSLDLKNRIVMAPMTRSFHLKVCPATMLPPTTNAARKVMSA
nr:hypothetical protein [Marinicella sp. W31]MDC2879392.1 hypothetical protein [Marinicella sp. W31]